MLIFINRLKYNVKKIFLQILQLYLVFMKGKRMAIINKIFDNVMKPVLRFDGWQTMGAYRRPADNRTTKQLLANIEYFAETNPEVAKFKKELKSMKPEHLGLVSDICELAEKKDMLSTNINIKELTYNGKSLFTAIIERLPKASKENPEALNFAQEVINQTDTTASKYFLAAFLELFKHPEASRHLAATKPFIKDIAEATLKGGYTMDFSKERKFVNAIDNFVNPDVKAENIEFLSQVSKAAQAAPLKTCYINPSEILNNKIPLEQMKENLETFNSIVNNLAKQTDETDLSAFVSNNVNLY